jgi:citrate lyase subunit beta / citryl-CoA lyase
MRVHLFVRSDPEKLASAVAGGADALWLEAPVEGSALRAARHQAANGKLYICVGSLDDDLDAAMVVAPDGIVLPVRDGADVQHLGVKLAVREAELGLADGATRIIALVETPHAVFHLSSFVSASPRLAAIAFDPRAFAATLGIENTTAPPLGFARNLTLLAAKAAGVAAILVDAGPNSAETCKAAKRDGFDAIVVRDASDIAQVSAIPRMW